MDFKTVYYSVALIIFSSAITYSQAQTLKNVKIIAHRGAAGLAPENTISAFAKAMEFNVDMVELDVHLSQDDSVIVIHDSNVERTTDGEGEIENLNCSYIKSLDAGSWFSEKYNSEHIPTLREVLQFVNGKTTVLIELKWPKEGVYKGLVKNVLQIIKECNAESWVIIQSFETKYLIEINQLNPLIQYHQLILVAANTPGVNVGRSINFGEFEPLSFVKSVNISHRFLNKKFVTNMHEQGFSVATYTVDSEEKMLKSLNCGIDAIITNRPDIAARLLRK